MPFSTHTHGDSPFQDTLAPFLQTEGLPFADVLTAHDVEEACAAEQVAFGDTTRAFWTPALTLWTFLSQVLHADKSCRAAVARAVVALALSRKPQDVDTGDYCRARAKLSAPLLQRLTLQVGDALEEAVPADWRWHGRHVVLVDGFTVTAPDTVENQKVYPQPNTQKPGLGCPLIRVVVLLGLATAALQGLALGPYQGKESGETALFRTLLDRLSPGTIVLADRFYCSYFMLVLVDARGADMVLRLHQRRASHFRRGRCLGRGDYVVTWPKPERPDWMDEELYEVMPEQIQVREVHHQVTQPGYRVKNLIVITTLLDAQEYPTQDIADLYHERWQVELDIRAIKASLKMDTLRCLTPFMVEKEIWTHFLGYNLIRKVAAQAAQQRGVPARAVSFTASLQVVTGAWSKLTEASPTERTRIVRTMLRCLGKEKVGDRPGRCEPRAVKRRPKKQKLLTKPRAEARADLLDKGAPRKAG
jgi:putative transposase